MERGADPCARNFARDTPLHLAAERTIPLNMAGHDHDAVVEQLLTSERVVEFVNLGGRMQENKRGYTPLLHACYGGHLKCAQLLIKAGAPLKIEGKKQRLPLHAAVISGHEEVARLLLEKDPELVDIPTIRTGRAALYFAAEIGYIDILCLLLSTMQNLHRDLETKLDSSLVAVSATNGHAAVVKCLLEHGAQIRTEYPGSHPLSIAASYGHREVFFNILEKYPEYPMFNNGLTILHEAAIGGCLEIVVHILQDNPGMLNAAGSKQVPFNREEFYNTFPLDIAAQHQHWDVLRFLMDKKAKFSTRLGVGFYFVASRGQKDIVEEALKIANPSQVEEENLDHFKFQLLAGAACHGQNELLQLLLDKYKLPLITVSGNSVLHEAARGGHTTTVKLLLARAGSKIDEKDGSGDTPLHLATNKAKYNSPGFEGGYLSVVKLLLDEGAEASSKDHAGNTALHTAAGSGNEKLVALLLEKGADINAINDDGDTPLHVAALKSPIRVATILLQHNPQADLKNNKGETPLAIAEANRKVTVSDDIRSYLSGTLPAPGKEQIASPVVKLEVAVPVTVKVEEPVADKSLYPKDLSIDADISEQDEAMAKSQIISRLERLRANPGNGGKKELIMPTVDGQLGCYLGRMQEMLNYMETKGKNTVGLDTVKKQIINNPHWWKDGPLGRWLRSIDLDINDATFQVDHIIPQSMGGVDHPYNYFLLCGSINQSFRHWYTTEKEVFMGQIVCRSARKFMQYVAREAKYHVNFNMFDPIQEGALR